MTESAVLLLAIGVYSTTDGRFNLIHLLRATDALLIVSAEDQSDRLLTVVAPRAAAADETPTALRIDSDRRVLCWQDREVALTPLEHDFLRCLVEAPGHIWTYQELHLRVWGNGHVGRGSDIHSIVRRVRGKLSRLGAGATVQVIRGVGLRLAV